MTVTDVWIQSVDTFAMQLLNTCILTTREMHMYVFYQVITTTGKKPTCIPEYTIFKQTPRNSTLTLMLMV